MEEFQNSFTDRDGQLATLTKTVQDMNTQMEAHATDNTKAFIHVHE